MNITYYIMHKELPVAELSDSGQCKIFSSQFMPYSLYLEENTDIDSRLNNLFNFYAWCSQRLLPIDRTYIKQILGSIGAQQAVTDKDRARISLSYHCLSLTDVFWVKFEGENVTFESINLYDNHLSNAFVDIPLRGKQMTATNKDLAQDLGTSGLFPKAWVRKEDGFYLFKAGNETAVENELLSSRIAQCFAVSQVIYHAEVYERKKVSVSKLFTSKERSLCTWQAYQLSEINDDKDPVSEMLALDSYSFYMMNIVDYLIGNTDRHWENWGFLIDNDTNRPLCLHPLMDFNQSFLSYDTVNGANCQTVLPRQMSQRAAAIEAVRKVGLNQNKDVLPSWFSGREGDYRMFEKRLSILRDAASA